MKKILSLVLALVMLLGTFAMAEHVSFTVNGTHTNSNMDYNHDALYDYIAQMFDFDYEVFPVSKDAQSEKIRTWVNGGTMPDSVTMRDFDYQWYVSSAEQGLLAPLPEGWEEDLKLICQPLDYYMQNIYEGRQIKHADNADGFETIPYPAGFPKNACNWPVTPKALYWGPKFLCERYGLPLIISENGMDCHDAVSLDGKVHDPNRVDFIHRYLLALKKACEEGAPVKGYFYWSFLDNFEWGKGYMERFGLTYVDYATQKRTLKDSATWYAEVMKENGENL